VRQKINKEISELNSNIERMESKDVYRIFHIEAVQYMFSGIHGTFSKIDNILRNKADLNKYKKTEITPSILTDHKCTKLEIHNKRNYRKCTNIWRLNNTLLNFQFIEISGRGEYNFLESNKNENITSQKCWDIEKAVLIRKFIAMSTYIEKSERNQ
jgi:hypothetical protein